MQDTSIVCALSWISRGNNTCCQILMIGFAKKIPQQYQVGEEELEEMKKDPEVQKKYE